jgi:transcriptional regulator with XRE-family HTH domain
MSHSQVGRIERGDIQDPSIGQLVRLAAALGMDLTVRAYPVADAIRDAAHVRLLDRLRRELPSSVTWRTEVPLPEPGDRRAWDAVIAGSGWRVHVEAETRIADMQALQRRLTIKIRDGGADRLILLVARTRANRAALAGSGGSLLAQFPLPERDVLAALRKGMDPGASGVVCL